MPLDAASTLTEPAPAATLTRSLPDVVLLVAAAVAFVLALGRPWIAADFVGYAPRTTLTALTGAASAHGSAVYQLYLLGVPLLLGIGTAAMLPGRHRTAFSAATAGLAVAIGIGLVALLASTVARNSDPDVNAVVRTSPTVLAGYYVAVAVPVLALLAVLRPVVRAIRTAIVGARSRASAGLAAAAFVAFALALWLPWLRQPDGTENRIDDLLFGSAYVLVMALLLAAVAAALATGHAAWRTGALVLAGCWTIIGLAITVEPSWVVFGGHVDSGTSTVIHHPAAGLYLGGLAIVLAGAAAWLAAGEHAGRRQWAVWMLLGLFAVSVFAPWMSYPDLGNVGILDGPGDATIQVNVVYLVIAPLLLAAAAIAITGSAATARWVTVGFTVALLAIEVAVIHWPRRFAYSEGREYFGSAAIGAYAAVLMTVLAGLFPWISDARQLTATESPGRRRDHSARAWLARIVLLGAAVAAVIALYTPWIETKYLLSDDADFQGDILRSPLGFVLILAGIFALVAAGAVVGGVGGVAIRAAATTAVLEYAVVAVGIRAHAVLVGYTFPVSAAYHWRPGWHIALVAGAITIVALMIAPSRSRVADPGR